MVCYDMIYGVLQLVFRPVAMVGKLYKNRKGVSSIQKEK